MLLPECFVEGRGREQAAAVVEDAFSVKSITCYYNRFQDGTNRFFHSSKQQLFYPQVPNYSLSDHIAKSQNNITEELRFTSKTAGRLTWVAGLFFTDDRETDKEYEYEPLANDLWLTLTGFDILDFFGVPLIDGAISYRDSRHDYEKEAAGFAEVSYEIADHLKLSAGLRASHTEFGFAEYSDGPFGAPAAGLCMRRRARVTASGARTPCCPIFAPRNCKALGSTDRRRRTRRIRFGATK